MNTIDCRGLICPIPVVNTKKYFAEIEKGVAKVIVDNEISKNNLVKFASANEFKYEVKENNAEYTLTMEKFKSVNLDNTKNDEFSILIGTDKLGNGDDKLGETLMKSYIYALSESDKMPRKIMFLNAGVKLVAKGSSVIESLEAIKAKGVEIASCGVCLDFYGLKDELLIGEITNMYSIIEEMNSVSKLIKL